MMDEEDQFVAEAKYKLSLITTPILRRAAIFYLLKINLKEHLQETGLSKSARELGISLFEAAWLFIGGQPSLRTCVKISTWMGWSLASTLWCFGFLPVDPGNTTSKDWEVLLGHFPAATQDELRKRIVREEEWENFPNPPKRSPGERF